MSHLLAGSERLGSCSQPEEPFVLASESVHYQSWRDANLDGYVLGGHPWLIHRADCDSVRPPATAPDPVAFSPALICSTRLASLADVMLRLEPRVSLCQQCRPVMA